MLDVWQAADDIDLFESAWNWDHFYPTSSATTRGPSFEGWTMLAAMAQATRRIRVGCQVTGMIYRHPAVLANMAATSTTSPTAGSSSVSAPPGTRRSAAPTASRLPPLKERFDRFDEGVEAIVALLTQETTTYDGRYVQLTEARCEQAKSGAAPAPAEHWSRWQRRTEAARCAGRSRPAAQPGTRSTRARAAEWRHHPRRGRCGSSVYVEPHGSDDPGEIL